MTPISSQLTALQTSLTGDWIRRWERNIWEGSLHCEEQFVALIIARDKTELFWAKSLPSKDCSIELKFQLMPTSKTVPRFQVHFTATTGAFIQNITAEFQDWDVKPTIAAPKEFETGVIVPFATINSELEFSFAAFAKTDVIVRRHYVWGLKPRLLEGMPSPWQEILTKGRHGHANLNAAV